MAHLSLVIIINIWNLMQVVILRKQLYQIIMSYTVFIRTMMLIILFNTSITVICILHQLL